MRDDLPESSVQSGQYLALGRRAFLSRLFTNQIFNLRSALALPSAAGSGTRSSPEKLPLRAVGTWSLPRTEGQHAFFRCFCRFKGWFGSQCRARGGAPDHATRRNG